MQVDRLGKPTLACLNSYIESRTGILIEFLSTSGSVLASETLIDETGHDADNFVARVRGKLPLPEGATCGAARDALRWWTGCDLLIRTHDSGTPLADTEILARVAGKELVGRLNRLMAQSRDKALTAQNVTAARNSIPREVARVDSTIAPYRGNLPFMFVSYSRGDAAKATPLIHALSNAKARIWWDDDIAAGSDFKPEIERKLRQSAATIVVLGASSLEEGRPQEWVYQESALTAELGRELLPIRTDDTPLPLGWRALVLHRQIIDARGDGFAQSVAAIIERASMHGCC